MNNKTGEQGGSAERIIGRGAGFNPTYRFTRIELAADLEHLDPSDEDSTLERTIATEYFVDEAKSVVSENDSPDIPFRYSLNPYRGCAHGCSYCYARPTHEYLNLSAGLDFESKIFVKERAPELFRTWLNRSGYQPEVITFSGVTDCYQPIERELQLTRRCLEVALEARQPIALITKNALVTRDIDVLKEMASRKIVSVAISITTLDQSLVKVMEPRTSSPQARLRALEQLSAAGIPAHVMVAPVIPALNDHEIPAVLKAAKNAGAKSAGYILLRLPMTVEPVFRDWLAREKPEQKDKIESRLRATRGGKLYETGFDVRMKGRGEIADQIGNTFKIFAHQLGLDRGSPELDASQFRPPLPASGQQWLF